MNKFHGFLPDMDTTTPGAVIACENTIPTTKGLKGAPSAIDAGLTAVSAAANSLVVIEKLDGTTRTFAGTGTTLEEEGSGSWTDRSRATPAYNCGTDARWSFAQFGDYTLAANTGDVIQVSTTAAFSNVAGSPQAEYIAVSDGFVMAVRLNSEPDKWHCSAYQDYTDWTEAVSTQCTSGRIIGGGRFTGLREFSNGFVAWKKNATYVATYVGAPIVFQWDEVPGGVGCVTGNASVSVGDRVAFLGVDDFYIFDGANNIPIGEGVREWFFENSSSKYLYKMVATYNSVTSNITWHYPSSSSADGSIDSAIVYNIKKGKWGKYSLAIEAAASYFTAGVTYEGLGSLYSTYDDLPTNITYDSPYWVASVAFSGVIKTDHILYTLTGESQSSQITMNNFGDDELYSTITRVRPRFLTAPSSSQISYSYDDTYGDNYSYGKIYNLINGKYDLMHSARWHQVNFIFSGDVETIGATITMVQDGTQ